jgi:hypothetical protein
MVLTQVLQNKCLFIHLLHYSSHSPPYYQLHSQQFLIELGCSITQSSKSYSFYLHSLCRGSTIYISKEYCQSNLDLHVHLYFMFNICKMELLTFMPFPPSLYAVAFTIFTCRIYYMLILLHVKIKTNASLH